MSSYAETIRLLDDTDAAEYADFRRASLLESPLAFGSSPEDDVLFSADAVRERLARGRDAVIIGAFADRLVGAAGVMREARRKRAHVVVIWGMYVLPGHREQGIASALLAAAIAHAKSLPGISSIQIAVTSAAPGARRLYERAGFRLWGTEPDALRHESESVEEYYLALRVEPPAS